MKIETKPEHSEKGHRPVPGEPEGPNPNACDNPDTCYDNDNNQDDSWEPPEKPKL